MAWAEILAGGVAVALLAICAVLGALYSCMCCLRRSNGTRYRAIKLISPVCPGVAHPQPPLLTFSLSLRPAVKQRYHQQRARRRRAHPDQLVVGFFHPYCNAGGGGERVRTMFSPARLHT